MRLVVKPTYANVTSTLALLVAVSGTSYAAVAQITNSSQIAPGSIQGSDLKANTLGSQQIGQIKGSEISGGSIGPKQVQGLTGADLKAASIGGQQIAPNSIGSQQIKSLTTDDISDDTVRGFAVLKGNYVIDQARSKDFILHTSGGGYYCLEWTAGTPSSAMATIDVSGADTRKAQVAVTTDQRSIDEETGCAPETNIVVTTAEVGNNANLGLPFNLWVLG